MARLSAELAGRRLVLLDCVRAKSDYVRCTMRIAQVCPYSLSVPGGVQGQVLSLARALRDLGHEARVLAPCDGPPPDPMVTPLGKSVPTASNGSFAPIAPDPSCALRTIQALRNEDFDVLHLHEPMVPGPTITSLVVSEVPMLGTFHATGTNLAYSYVPWLTRRISKKLNVRTAVSEEARLSAERNLRGKYEMMFNGIDIKWFAAAPPHRKDAPTIFFVGRHEPRKGLAVLLDALDLLPDDVRLWVAGSGPQTAALRAATSDDHRVEWLGRISESEKASRMRAADVFCAPSTEGESFGVVLLEAMACGTPIAASDLAGYRNVARADRDALLSEPSDSRALAANILRILDSPELADELRTNGAQRAEEFSMEHLAAQYVRLYERCVSGYPFLV